VRRTLEVLRLADADVICMQEQKDRAREYADALGYNVLVQDGSTAILTRGTIVRPSERGWGAQIDLPDGRGVWVFNVHFPAAPYQPYQLTGIPYHNGRFISTEAQARTEARLARGEPALRCLRDMQEALASGLPVFLAGDFNEPSCLDWTPEAVGSRGLPVAVDWPTTRMFHDAGFTDSFRAAHPDPVAMPGFTWTPRPDTRDVMDRIDLILFAGPGVRVLGSRVIGEPGPASDAGVEGFPSDHRAVVSIFELAPSP
jgi:exonuclease III